MFPRDAHTPLIRNVKYFMSLCVGAISPHFQTTKARLNVVSYDHIHVAFRLFLISVENYISNRRLFS